MDIEKEAFKAWFKKEYLGIDNLANQGDEGAITRRDYAYVGWQAAKAKAIPNGFVLVSIDDLARAAQNIRELNSGEYYSEEIEENVCAIETMIEAQESNHD